MGYSISSKRKNWLSIYAFFNEIINFTYSKKGYRYYYFDLYIEMTFWYRDNNIYK